LERKKSKSIIKENLFIMKEIKDKNGILMIERVELVEGEVWPRMDMGKITGGILMKM